MADSKRLNRRSFLTRVAGGAVAAGGAMFLVAGTAHAQIQDQDSGANGDPGGHGRGTGHTDTDPNDGACNGRGRAPNGINDQDPGDPQGNGRGTGHTDSDAGANSDRPCGGHGR